MDVKIFNIFSFENFFGRERGYTVVTATSEQIMAKTIWLNYLPFSFKALASNWKWPQSPSDRETEMQKARDLSQISLNEKEW